MLIARLKYAVIVFVLTLGSDAFADLFGSGTNQFSMDFVPIGNPGNIADTTGSPNPAGAVGYNYRMGKFEVSEDMITKYNAEYGTANGLAITKITRGTNKPATSVSWNEAARFTNWLNISTGGFAAYKFTTSGVNDNIALWTASDTLDYNAANPFRSLRANYVLPSVDEWYKAAYYDPNTSTYYDYPTGSNSVPTAVAGGTLAGTAVYSQPSSPGPADVNNAGGLSPFGVMGLGGNVFEWEETEFDLVNDSVSSLRGARGGEWIGTSGPMRSSVRQSHTPEFEFSSRGFRVASLSSIPEPSSTLLVGIGSCVWSLARRRRAKNV
jgi:formylglycine-generating enzyme